MRERPRNNFYRFGFTAQRANQFADDQSRRIGRTLFVFSILDAENIAGILYQSMLKAASGSEEWHIVFARESNRVQRAVHADVWTTRRAPQRIELFQRCRNISAIQRFSRHPGNIHNNRQRIRRMIERIVRRQVIWRFGIIVADNAHVNALIHVHLPSIFFSHNGATFHKTISVD